MRNPRDASTQGEVRDRAQALLEPAQFASADAASGGAIAPANTNQPAALEGSPAAGVASGSGARWQAIRVILLADLALYACLVVAPLAVYAGRLSGPFVFDDEQAIVANETIRDLTNAAVLSPPRETPVAARPAINLSFALDRALFGAEPFGFHLVNLALHVLSALLVFASLRRLLNAPALPASVRLHARGYAFATALLFALHPLASEVVLYASQRTEGMVAVCYLAAIHLLIRAADQGRAGHWLSALAIGVIGAASKEVFVSAPLAALCLDRAFYTGSFARAWRARKRFYLALSVCVPVLVWLQLGGPRPDSVRFGEASYLLAQARVVPGYFGAAFWPSSLAIDHGPLPANLDPTALVVWAVPMGLLVIACARLAWTHPRVGFLGVWILGCLAPSSSFFSIHTEVGADRRFYLPLVALIAYVVVGAGSLLARAVTKQRVRSLAACLAVALASLALGWTTRAHTRSYATARDVWQQVVRTRPNNPRGHYNLAETYRREGDAGRAIASLSAALALDPTYADAHVNLGNLRMARGELREGLFHLQRGAALAPTDYRVHYNLAIALALSGQPAAALAELEETLRLKPGHVEARRKLAAVYRAVGRPPEPTR